MELGSRFWEALGKSQVMSLALTSRKEIAIGALPRQNLIAPFSGDGTAKRMQISDMEKFNMFEFSQEFADFYKSRQGSFGFAYPKSISTEKLQQHCYLGQNTRDDDVLSDSSVSDPAKTSKQTTYKSPLFHWLAGLIVTPVLITTIVISAIVLTMISNNLPTLTKPINDEYVTIKDSFRTSATRLLASQASAVMSKAARDTYVLTRFMQTGCTLEAWIYLNLT